MEKLQSIQQDFLDELHTKWFLTEMKCKLVQTICSLMEDELYTKNDAVRSLIEIVGSIELEEERIHPGEISERLKQIEC